MNDLVRMGVRKESSRYPSNHYNNRLGISINARRSLGGETVERLICTHWQEIDKHVHIYFSLSVSK